MGFIVGMRPMWGLPEAWAVAILRADSLLEPQQPLLLQ
jgi:hypothetical protein